MPKRGNEIPDQVVRQRARRLDSLLLEGNRSGLGLADPDRQVTVTVGLAQQQHRLGLRLLDANADDANFTHLCLPSAPAAVSDPDLPRRRSGTPSRRRQLSIESLVLQRCRTSRTADLTNDVCKVMVSAATSRARSSARSRAPALPALTSGPAIFAIKSDCRSAADRNARRWRGSTPYSASARAHCKITTACSSKNPPGPVMITPALSSAVSSSLSTPERSSRSSRLSRMRVGATDAESGPGPPAAPLPMAPPTDTNRGTP